MTGQTKLHSFIECIINVAIGYVFALGAQLIIFPYYNINIPFQQNLAICGWFTLVSIIRSYIIRRWFNKITLSK
ncbi:MAG: DUF7220 family protein [Nitrososphaeraceae archaeon]